MEQQPWVMWQSRCRGIHGLTYLFDVKKGDEGLRLVVTQSYPSGHRERITIAEDEVEAVVRELLRAVSAMAGPEVPPGQHPPKKLAKIRREYPKAYTSWTAEEDALLLQLRSEGHGIAHLAREFQRQPSAISSRIRRLLGS